MAEKKETYPVLPLRDIVVYPKMVVPLFVGREKSIRALQAGVDSDKNIILATQKDPVLSAGSLRYNQFLVIWSNAPVPTAGRFPG
mgnify:CR=1 FL=1